MDEFVDRLNRGPVRVRHVPPLLARTLAHFHPELTTTLVDVLLADSLPDVPAADEAFGVSLHSLERVYGMAASEGLASGEAAVQSPTNRPEERK